MSVEYWLSYNNGAEKLRLPINPEQISVTSPFEITDVVVTHIGEYSIFGERGLKELSFSSFFPKEYASYCEYEDFPSPSDCIKTIEGWRDKKKPIRLVVTGTNINIAVTIRDFTMDYQRFASMGDIYYTITFKEYRWIPAQKTVDISEANAKTKSAQKAEIDATNMERGYCPLPFPPVSDVWSEQAYMSVLPDIQRYFTDYAELILAAKDVVSIGESDKVNEWIAILNVAAETKDVVLGATCLSLAALLRITQTGDSRMYYTNLADMLLEIASEVPYRVYHLERYTGDYDGNFDEYYQQKRTEMELWYNVN